ncbi:hypothetical protein BASA83_013820 [Batrachochytrium salamandrivorans]|nr:hypothetical protein BASA83_013820 [Batrachochytrium salamandrivorans]
MALFVLAKESDTATTSIPMGAMLQATRSHATPPSLVLVMLSFAADASYYRVPTSAEILKAFAKRGLGSKATSSRKNPTATTTDTPSPDPTNTDTTEETSTTTTKETATTTEETATATTEETATATKRSRTYFPRSRATDEPDDPTDDPTLSLMSLPKCDTTKCMILSLDHYCN